MGSESIVESVTSDFIKNRIKHPVIGPFIISFFFTYLDILLIAIGNVSFDIEYAVDTFKSDFLSNKLRITIPIFASIFFPIVEPIFRSYYQRILAFWDLRTKAKIEKEANEIAKNRLALMESINNELMSKNSTLKSQFTSTLNNYLDYLRNKNPGRSFLLVQIAEVLDQNDLVGKYPHHMSFGKFSKGLFPIVFGTVERKLDDRLYILKVLSQFAELQNDKNFALPRETNSFLVYDHLTKDLSQTQTPINADYVIAGDNGNNSWMPKVDFADNVVDEKFQNLILGIIFEQSKIPEKKIKQKRIVRLKKAFNIIFDI